MSSLSTHSVPVHTHPQGAPARRIACTERVTLLPCISNSNASYTCGGAQPVQRLSAMHAHSAVAHTPLQKGSSRKVQLRALAARKAPWKQRVALRVSAFNADYSATDNAAYWSTRPVAVIKRALTIGQEFVRWRLRSAVAEVKARNAAKRGLKWGAGDSVAAAIDDSVRSSQEAGGHRSVSAALLREVLVKLGPAFVKIGQALSSRPDVLPPEYLAELELLQDRIPPFDSAEARQVLEAELRAPLSTLFTTLSDEPVAAASLGQVYRGVLASGEAVAVKVQRPGVGAAIALDVFILRWLAAVLRRARRLNTDLPSLVDEWATSLFRELDYTREADNAIRFKALFSHMPEVYVPFMYTGLTTGKVLTMEWVDGVRLRSASSTERLAAVRAHAAGTAPASGGDGDGLRGTQNDIALVEVGVRCSLEQMLEEGFYHADPHPGNLLKMADGRLAYLDFGMCGSLDRPTRQALITATLHLVNKEYGALADDFVALGLLPRGADRSRIVPALTGVFQGALAGGVSNVSFGDLSTNLGRTMYQFSFRIPPYYTLLVRSLSVLEGIALASDPGYKVLAAAYPWVARRLLTDTSPELRSTLRSLLYDPATGAFRFSRLESLMREAVRTRPSRPGAAVRAAQEQRQAAQQAQQLPSLPLSLPLPPLQRPAFLPEPPSFLPDPFAVVNTLLGLGLPADSSSANGSMATPTAGSRARAAEGSALGLVLGDGGEFVRDILLEELAKGIDAAWRLAADSAADTALERLALLPAGLLPLPLPTRPEPVAMGLLWTDSASSSGSGSSAGAMPALAPARSTSTVHDMMPAAQRLAMSLPRLASAEDAEQIRGLQGLASAMLDLSASGNGAGSSHVEGMLPGSRLLPAETREALTQAAEMAAWLAQELAALPPSAREVALGLPADLAGRVSSRIAARALRSAFATSP